MKFATEAGGGGPVHALLSTVDLPDSAWPRRSSLLALRRRFSWAALFASASSMRSERALAACSALILSL